MILGAQLFTIRDYIQNERDFERSIKKISDIGYTTVQISGLGGGIKTERIREICDKHGLKIVLTHVGADRILHDTDKLIEEHNILGCDYIGLGMMPDKYISDYWFQYFVEDFQEPIKKIAASGKLFMYHNHNFEFEKMKEGRIIERLLDAFPPEELGITLDTYWIQAAGADVLEWIKILKDRIPCVHLKDMTVKGFEQRFAPVLEGNMNFPAIFEALKETNAKYLLVEQDNSYGENPFDCLEKSYKNCIECGLR